VPRIAISENSICPDRPAYAGIDHRLPARLGQADGNRTDSAALQQARTNCQVDEKMAALEQDRADNSVEASKAPSNEARMLQLDNFEGDNFAIYQVINDCMQREGYRQP
jgi:hypothetical protein